jgi:hypothetical protein
MFNKLRSPDVKEKIVKLFISPMKYFLLFFLSFLISIGGYVFIKSNIVIKDNFLLIFVFAVVQFLLMGIFLFLFYKFRFESALISVSNLLLITTFFVKFETFLIFLKISCSIFFLHFIYSFLKIILKTSPSEEFKKIFLFSKKRNKKIGKRRKKLN